MNRYFCFFTTHYAAMAEACIKSFAQFGLTVDPAGMRAYPEGWMKACMSRSRLLVNLAADFPDDGIGLLDADLTCLQNPEWLKIFGNGRDGLFSGRLLNCDVAVHDLTDVGRTADHRCQRYSAGVTCFAPTPAGRACLKRWAELCELDPEPSHELREQVYLYTAIEEGRKNGLSVFNLGPKYNRPIDEMTDGDGTVILHHVASRKLRGVIGGGL